MSIKRKQVRFTVCCLILTATIITIYIHVSYSESHLRRRPSLNTKVRDIENKKVNTSIHISNTIKPLKNKIKMHHDVRYPGGNTRELSKQSHRTKTSFCAYPKSNIAFLKTHKTAGSTITNIVQRFGHFRNQTFAMPFKDNSQHGFNYIGEPGDTISHDNLIPKKSDEEYNILCNHVVYNEKAFQETLPHDTFLFTIIREPFHQFISTLNYYGSAQSGYLSFLNLNISVSAYLQSPLNYEPTNPYLSMTNNKMSLDLGMPTNYIRNEPLFRSYIQKLRSKFKLVLLQEYFDESLVLLRRHTCWSLKDIIYLSHNRWPAHRTFKLSADDTDQHRKWNKADYVLYETFFSAFWEKILGQQDFFPEVNYFKHVQQKVVLFCSKHERSSRLKIVKSKWNEEFTLTAEDCFYMRLNETKFTELIHKKMMHRAFPFGNFSFPQTANKDDSNKFDMSLFGT